MTMGKVRMRLPVVYGRSRRKMMQNLVLDEADSVSVDDKSTSKKIGTQENSYVQEITKPENFS